MANGDSVKSWTSSNKRIVTVNNKGVITAGTTSGTAKVTVTLKSGKKASLIVKVQPTKVINDKDFRPEIQRNPEGWSETGTETGTWTCYLPGWNHLYFLQQRCSSCKS